jgi:hypothetical protein
MSPTRQTANAVDVSQAAELTGLSKKALRRRLERGTLDSMKVGGRRMIPISELSRRGLLDTGEDVGAEADGSASSATAVRRDGSGSPSPASAREPTIEREPSAQPPPVGEPPPAEPAPAAVAPPPPPAAPTSPAPQAAEQAAVYPAQPAPIAPAPQAGADGRIAPPPDRYHASREGFYPARGAWYYWYEYPAVRWLAALLALGLVALLAWLLILRPDGGDASSVQPGAGPAGATQEDLVALAQELRQPVYWAGELPGTRLELTQSNNSYSYVRYLTDDAPVGDPSPDFLTVGTYPSLNAFGNLRSYAVRSDARTTRIDNGGLVVTVPGSPTSVYLSYPHEDVQVEVYDPDPGRALNLVKTGVVRPVTAGTQTLP